MRRTGSLAASFLAQICAAGVLLLVPLLYREALPALRLSWAPTYLPLAPTRPPAAAAASTETSGPSLRARVTFHAPQGRSSAIQQTAGALISDAPAFDFAPPAGDFGPPVGPSIMGELIRPPAPPTTPAAEPARPSPAPVRVSGGVLAARLIRKIIPVYPPLARQARVQGTVRLVGIIARDGTIHQLQLLSGHPLLVPAALAAVRQWIYKPTLLNGEAVEVIAPIDVTFTLAPLNF